LLNDIEKKYKRRNKIINKYVVVDKGLINDLYNKLSSLKLYTKD
jgi:hypothetical protein